VNYEEFKAFISEAVNGLHPDNKADNWEERLSACNACEHMTDFLAYNGCSFCLCPIKKLVMRKHKTCPAGKWV